MDNLKPILITEATKLKSTLYDILFPLPKLSLAWWASRVRDETWFSFISSDENWKVEL